MDDFLYTALLAGNFLMLSIVADVLYRIYEILDCWDDDKNEDEEYEDSDEDDDWPEPDLNH